MKIEAMKNDLYDKSGTRKHMKTSVKNQNAENRVVFQ